MAAAALWTCPSSFFVVGAALYRRGVRRVFLQIALAGLRQVATRCKFRGRRGIPWDLMKINGSFARNIDFEVANFEVPKKTRRKTSILRLQSVKIGGSLARNARFAAPMCLVPKSRTKCSFSAPTCLVSSLWFSCGFAVSMGEAAKPLLFEGFQAGCDVVLRGRRGALWHSNLFYTVSKILLCGCATMHSTLYTLHSTLYTPHSTLHLYTPHSTHYTPHSTLHRTLHFTHFTHFKEYFLRPGVSFWESGVQILQVSAFFGKCQMFFCRDLVSTYGCVKLCSLPANPKEFGRHMFRDDSWLFLGSDLFWRQLSRLPEHINWETHWVHKAAKSWLARRLAERKEIG